MSNDDPRREADFYRRQLEELTGENIRLDYVVSGLRHEVGQKRGGFALLAELQQKIAANMPLSATFDLVIAAINASLGMERTVVLTPIAQENTHRPAQWIGYVEEDAARLEATTLTLPAELVDGEGALLVNKSTPSTPFIEAVRERLNLPFFVLAVVKGERAPIGVLVSGRMYETRPLFPPLDSGDVDTFRAIAGLIAASVRNMRVALLEESDRLKSEFFANISHEFRTPITLTLGPIEQLLSGRFGDLPEAARERLVMVQRNQERLLNLVNQILDLARLEAGGSTLRASPAGDINQTIERRLAQFHAVTEQRGLQLRAHTDPAAAEADLYLDAEKFEKLLTNLVSNAVKFTREGVIDVSTSIRDGSFWLEVRDTGIGIKADQLPHIFDRFRQADGSEAREYAGSGIGLALVKEIATLHGGDVTVFSEYGRGSRFRVRFPLGNQHLDAETLAAQPEEASGPIAPVAIVHEGRADREGTEALNREAEANFDAERPTVLYAEDNADLRRHVRDVLQERFNVFVAADGQDGLRLARHYRPDVVVADQMMPRMSGRELLLALRDDKDLRDTPLIFLSARAGVEARVESLAAGADDYLTKPFHESELRARVSNLVRARRQSRDLADLNRRLESRVQEQMGELVRAGDLMRFLPRAVAESVIQGEVREELLQRRKITVLAIAPEGVPALMEALEPEELSSVVNELLRELLAIAIERGGTVTHAEAGQIVVLFGAPSSMDVTRQAESAIEAAVRMRDAVPNLRVRWRRRGIVDDVTLRMGINTGFCTVGMFGSEHLRSYTAVGPPAVAAVRLAEVAGAGEILCAVPTFAMLEPAVEGSSRGPIAVPGVSRPVDAYSVTAFSGLTERAPDAPARPASLIGTQLGRYRVVERLGAGGMGEVYRARDTRLDRDIALKVLSSHLAGDEAAVKRFQREAKAVAALKHPNIVAIHSFENDRDRSFITMDLVEGRTADQAIPRDGMPIRELLAIAVPVVDALAAAHQSGITHRDIKPSNLMIGRDRVTILDFGLAKRDQEQNGRTLLAGGDDTATHSGTIMGTLAYSAPEVLQGHEPDRRSDLFSMGVVLYEMATGSRPFRGTTAGAVLASILRDEPEPLSASRPDMPSALSRVVGRCLEKDPARRHGDTRDLLRELQMLSNAT